MNVHEPKVDASEFAETRPEQRVRPDDDTDIRSPPARRRPVLSWLMKSVVPVLVIGAGLATYQYLKATRPEKQSRPPQERVFSVKTIAAEAKTVQPKIKVYGTTVSGRRVDIRALVSGRVIETSSDLREGGSIGAGDMLVRIDPFSYESAVQESSALLAEAKARVNELEASIASDTASLKSAQEQLALAKTDVARAEPLAKRGTVSKRVLDERIQTRLTRQQSVDQLTNSIKVWTAKVEQQKATIARLEAALALSERRLDETVLKAPFNAYVVDVTSQEGRMVGANDKIATLIDRDWMEVKFTLSNQQFGRLVADSKTLEGRDVDIVWVLGSKEVRYPAKIVRVGAEVSADTGGVEMLARIDNPSTPIPLRAGAFVDVYVPDTTFEGVFQVPPTALYSGDTVYVVEDERLVARQVDVVGSLKNDLLIKGPIASGAQIVATRVSTPGTGVRVQVVE